MQMSPYWRAVAEVGLFLLAISLLSSLTGAIFSLLSFGLLALVLGIIQALVPVVGALVYLDWRWGWRADTIGLTGARHLRWLPAGLGLGALALVLTQALGLLFGGALVPALHWAPANLILLLPILIGLLSVELLFRGGATARLQADLARKEALLTALALPLVAFWLSGMLFSIPTGIRLEQPWTLFFTATLTLLYLRTGALWLNLGLAAVVYGLPPTLGLAQSPQASLLLWAVVAIILAIMAWNRVDRLPRRVGPQRQQRARRYH